MLRNGTLFNASWKTKKALAKLMTLVVRSQVARRKCCEAWRVIGGEEDGPGADRTEASLRGRIVAQGSPAMC
jgi:hypothetical protein